ncbi:hypothetical protein ASC75_02965 [Aminobacter sp. DSM 101952]|uniref:DUF3137 domain-containing protein n=1 Tax=Aminobacter sp. DSM 101952 TaxID=2735891 RepID=UPI0006FED0C0|nr:DUF3137 domain-containing protein [Aminobacter sp. DSM 101952]KQU76587.1 hypothetical protein ASC75_02965 [Aminobacter sp. DSM 101952]
MSAAGFMPDEAVIAGIRRDIDAYEARRKAAKRSVLWRVPLFLGLLVLAIAVLAVVFNLAADPAEVWVSTPHLYLYAAAFLVSFFVYFRAAKPAGDLQASLREKLLPIAFGFVGDMRLAKGETPRSFGRLPRETIGDYDDSHFDDIVSGTYEGFSFELYETALSRRVEKSDVHLFDGIIVAFDMAKPFPGTLVATLKTNTVMGFFREMFGGGLQEIASGGELDKAYDFRTDNVEAAQPLVSGQMAQALDWLKEAWPGEPARIALVEGDGFLLLPHKKEFFELPASTVALDYKAHVEPMITDIATILATAALVRKIGT